MLFFRIANKRQLVCLAAVFAIMLAVFSVAFSGAGIASASASRKKLPIYSVGRDDKVVSLSFDAAWGAGRVRTLPVVCFA